MAALAASQCLGRQGTVARHTGGGLAPRKTGVRDYRDVCWVSAEGTTERDYLGMSVFRDARMSIRFPKNTHPSRHNPAAVLRRFEKSLRENDFRTSDEAWLVVDVDDWREAEFSELLAWEAADTRHHLAVSNPKFELFLVMHYEKGNCCTTPEKVDAALKKHWPRYSKRVSQTQFSVEQVRGAIENAKAKRRSCASVFPACGMTDAHLLVDRLLR